MRLNIQIIDQIDVYRCRNPSRFFFIVFLVWSTWISFLYWAFGPFSYLRVHDNGDGNLIYRVIAARDLIHYGITTWRPEFLGGIDALTLPGLPHFIFDSLPFLIFPPWMAYGLLMFIQRFFSSYFTFRLCRDCLGMNELSSIFAGFAFSLLEWSMMDWTLYHGLGLPAAPFFLWALEKGIQIEDRKKYLFIGTLGLLLSLVAPFVLFIPFFWGLTLLWFVIIREIKTSQFMLCYMIFILSTILPAVPEIHALLLNAPLTGRTSSYDIGIDNLIRGLIQDISIGFVSIFLIFLSSIVTKFSNRTLNKLVILCIFIEIASRSFTFFSPWTSVHMNFLATFSLNRFGQFVYLLVPITGGYSIHAISKFLVQKSKKKESNHVKKDQFFISLFSTIVGFLGISACIIGSIMINTTILGYMPSDNYYINYENLALKTLAEKDNEGQFRIATVGCRPATTKKPSESEIFPMYASMYGFDTIDGYNSFHFKRFSEYWYKVVEPIIAKDSQLQNNARNYLSHWMYLYAPLNGSFESEKDISFSEYYNLNLLSLANTKYLVSRWPLNHSSLQPVYTPKKSLQEYDSWEKKCITEQINAYLHGDYPSREIYIYKNKDVIPRIFFVHQMINFDSTESLLNYMSNSSLDDLKRTAYILSSDFALNNSTFSSSGNATINITYFSPDQIRLNLNSEVPGILIITNNYSPYWYCNLNGKDTKIFPVNHAFQGVYIVNGISKINLSYKRPSI